MPDSINTLSGNDISARHGGGGIKGLSQYSNQLAEHDWLNALCNSRFCRRIYVISDVRIFIMESKSVSTQENLLFSRELMDKEKPKIIIVTTSRRKSF